MFFGSSSANQAISGRHRISFIPSRRRLSVAGGATRLHRTLYYSQTPSDGNKTLRQVAASIECIPPRHALLVSSVTNTPRKAFCWGRETKQALRGRVMVLQGIWNTKQNF
jgi:hypothetical protein